MIRFIAALDVNQGIANEHGIPWQGRLPTDVKYFRDKTLNGTVMMGYGWYKEQQQPLPNRRNLVAIATNEVLRPGFETVHDAVAFLKDFKEDIWVGGGAALFASTISLADELYITQLDRDFQSTKFFPEFKNEFELVSESSPVTENGISFTFQVWMRQK